MNTQQKMPFLTNILVVDDLPDNLFAMEKVLRRLDVELIKANSGKEAITQALNHDLALILLDVQMPDMNGYEAAELLRKDEKTKNIPIIFITAIDREEEREIQGYDSGAIDYIFKPINPRILLSKVRVFIQLYQYQKNLMNLNATLERRVAARTEALEQSNQELEQFLFISSHDLQEPLRMVGSCTQILAKDYKDKLDEAAQEYISFAVDGAQRMKSLITDLREFSEISRMDISKQVNTENVCKEIVENLEVLIGESGAKIAWDALPVVRGNEQLILKLFSSLVDNAIKYRGEGTPFVHISVEKSEKEYVFSVRDNGIGIDQQYAERIFLIFQRLHKRGEYSGTGAGLAICKKIVEHHGGRIWVKSEKGKGSVFCFAIPNKGNVND